MSANDAEVLNDPETDPMAEVSGYIHRSQRAEAQPAVPTGADEALLDHHIEEAIAALDDLARVRQSARGRR